MIGDRDTSLGIGDVRRGRGAERQLARAEAIGNERPIGERLSGESTSGHGEIR